MGNYTLPKPTFFEEGYYNLLITDVQDNKINGQLKINMQDVDGRKLFKTYFMKKKSGEVNTGTINHFAWFCRTALQNSKITDINIAELVGCFIQVKVTPTTYTDKEGEEKNSYEINEFKKAPLGFDTPLPGETVDLTNIF